MYPPTHANTHTLHACTHMDAQGAGLLQVKVRPSPVEKELSGDIKQEEKTACGYMTAPSRTGSVVRPGN